MSNIRPWEEPEDPRLDPDLMECSSTRRFSKIEREEQMADDRYEEKCYSEDL